jgi:hypothetical protein
MTCHSDDEDAAPKGRPCEAHEVTDCWLCPDRQPPTRREVHARRRRDSMGNAGLRLGGEERRARSAHARQLLLGGASTGDTARETGMHADAVSRIKAAMRREGVLP